MATISANGSTGKQTFKLTVTESGTNAAANTSTISYSFTIGQSGQGSWPFSDMGTDIRFAVVINGVTVKNGYIPSYDGSSTVTLASGTTTVTHNDNGTKTVSYSFSVVDAYPALPGPGNASASGSLALTSFTRYSLSIWYGAEKSAGGWNSIQTSTVYVSSGQSYTIPHTTATIPTGNTKTGSRFSYWTAGYGTLLGGGTPGSTSIKVTQNLTVEVYYPLITYTVSYNANGGTGAPSAQTKKYGVNLTLSSTKPTKGNTTTNGYTVTFNSNGGVPASSTATATNTHSYTFSKWNTAANGSGVSYNPGVSYTNNRNATLYAQWIKTVTKNPITTPLPTRQENTIAIVTLDANGGSVNSSSLTSSGVENYSCAGWYTAASGGAFRANAGATYNPSNNETLYAHWTSLGLIYDVITLPTPTREGHEFLGWSINQSDTSGITGSYTPTGNITLYAIWKAETKGAVRIKTSSSSEMKMHLVMIHTSSGWKQHIPLIFTKNGWKICG